MTVREFRTKMLAAGHKCTLLGIGPVSENAVRAAFLASARRKCPPMFIASRNQVDLDSLGGGYLMGGMDQFKFVKLINSCRKKSGYTGPVYICRDHGGPWQRNTELDGKLPVAEAMKKAEESFAADIEAGFNYLHIDPTKCPHKFSQDDLCARTVSLMESCERVRKGLGLRDIDYEVGTEDIQGGLTDASVYEGFMSKLSSALKSKGLPQPVCIVGQTGTLTRMDNNIGHFDRGAVKSLVKVAEKYGAGLKEHNGDYLSGITCRLHPMLGVAGMNVAPEFGLVETDALLELAAREEKLLREGWIKDAAFSNLQSLLLEKTFTDSPWKKWLTPEQKKLQDKEIGKDHYLRLLIARVCGHYVYCDPQVEEAVSKLFKNINALSDGKPAAEFVIEKIAERIEFYITNFNMDDINILMAQNSGRKTVSAA